MACERALDAICAEVSDAIAEGARIIVRQRSQHR